MGLLERDTLVADLAERTAGVATSGGAVVLITGEAGIGKTSLVRAFISRHPPAQVLRGACDATGTPRPLGPLHDIARTVGGDLAGLMVADARRFDRFTALLDVLGRPPGPTVVVIEDLHWADAATLDMLLFVARRIETVPALMLVTCRDDELGAGHPVRELLGRLSSLPTVTRMAVPALSLDAVRRLEEEARGDGRRTGARDATALHRLTGGNPFFVTELLHAAESMPASVQDAVLARTARLSGRARAALEVVAVVPDRVETAMVEAIAGPGLDESERAGVVQVDGRHVAFRHELARLAVEAAVPAGRRTQLHAAVLTRLERESHAPPSRLAYHAEHAQDDDAVRRYAPVAAREAAGVGAHREAVRHYRTALALTGTSDPDLARLLEACAAEHALLGQTPIAVEVSATALALYRRLGDVERAAALMARRALWLWAVARGDDARATVLAAAGELAGRPEGPALAAVLTSDAYLRMLARDIAGAVDVGTRAIELAERSGDAVQLARALNAVGSAQWFGDVEQAEPHLVRALEVARAAGDDNGAAAAMVNLGSGAGEVRRYATAEHWLQAGVDWCRQRDLDANLDYCTAWLARTRFEQGDWPRAEELALEALSSPTIIARIVAATVLGRLAVRRGSPDQGWLAEAWELAERTGDLQRLWPVAAGRAEAAWLAGDARRVDGLVGPTLARAEGLGHRWAIGELAFWRWRADPAAPVPPTGTPFEWHATGRSARAATAWADLGCPYESALALSEVSPEDPDHAGDLRSALRVLDALGARPAADRAAALLRELGDRPRRPRSRTVGNPGGLTDRELEVAHLLVARASNAEIAAQLQISVRTAGHHVSAVLAKLGVGSRREVALGVDAWAPRSPDHGRATHDATQDGPPSGQG